MAALLAVSLAPPAALAQSTDRTIVDAAYRNVAVPQDVERALAAGPPAVVALYTLARDKMVGWPRSPSAAARTFIPERYADLPVYPRLTGRGEPGYDRIVALRPDVIVDVGTVSPAYARTADRVQQATRIPYVLLDGSLRGSPALYRTLGDLLNERVRAKELAARSAAILDLVKSRLATVAPAERKRVYMVRGGAGSETWGAGAINAEIIDMAGAVNVAASAGNGEVSGVTPRQVAAWNPDAIIAIDPDFMRTIASEAAWKQVPAVAAGRVYLAPQQPFGWVDEPPGVNRLLGLRWLAGVLYPERFTDDVRALTRDFYTAFYSVTPSDRQLDDLLGAAPSRGR